MLIFNSQTQASEKEAWRYAQKQNPKMDYLYQWNKSNGDLHVNRWISEWRWNDSMAVVVELGWPNENFLFFHIFR